jgi:hypothetical protein
MAGSWRRRTGRRPILSRSMPDGMAPATAPPPARARARASRLSGSALSLPRRLLAGVRRAPLPLVALLVVAAVVGFAWSVATAPLNGPDEMSHIGYSQYLAETGKGPKPGSGTGWMSTQALNAGYELYLIPIISNFPGKPMWDRAKEVERSVRNDPQNNGSGPNPLAQNPPLYYGYEAAAYHLSPDRSVLGRFFAMRMANLSLFLVTVLMTWLLASELFAAMWVRFLMTGLVALQPKLGFMAGVVNSDTLLVTISTAFLWAATRLIRHGPTVGRVTAVALLAGLGPLTHGRGFALVPPAVVALVTALWPLRRQLQAVAGRLAVAAVAIGTPIAIGLLWTRGDSGTAFGGEVGQAGEPATNIKGFLGYVWQFYFDKLSFMAPAPGPHYGYRQVYIETFFGSFGSLDVVYPGWVVDVLQVGAAIGLALIGAVAVARWQEFRGRIRLLVLYLTTFGSLVGLLHIASYRDLAAGGEPLFTGRYLLPGVALYALAVAWVVRAFPRRAAALAGAALLAVFALLSIGGIGMTLARFDG